LWITSQAKSVKPVAKGSGRQRWRSILASAQIPLPNGPSAPAGVNLDHERPSARPQHGGPAAAEFHALRTFLSLAAVAAAVGAALATPARRLLGTDASQSPSRFGQRVTTR
jgi:hypothetical protein